MITLDTIETKGPLTPLILSRIYSELIVNYNEENVSGMDIRNDVRCDRVNVPLRLTI